MFAKRIFYCLFIFLISGCGGEEKDPFLSTADVDILNGNSDKDLLEVHIIDPDALVDTQNDINHPDQVELDESLPDQVVTDEGLPDQVVPDESLPDQVVADEGLPDQVVTDEGLPDQVVTDEGLPDQVLPDITLPELIFDGDQTDADQTDSDSSDQGLMTDGGQDEDQTESDQLDVYDVIEDEIGPTVVTVTVNSMPEQGASFFVNDVFMCLTQCTVDLEVGWYSLRFEKMGYETIVYDYEVTINTNVITVFMTENPSFISFEISSNPIGAQTFLDGNPIGETPVQASVLSGEYSIGLYLDGYYPYLDNLMVVDGMQDVLFDLQPIPQIDVAFTSSPDGVTVCLDEPSCSDPKITPFSESLYAGTYTIYASKGGYVADTFDVDISAINNNVHIVLDPINLSDYLGWLDGTFELEDSIPIYQVVVTTEPHDATRWRIFGFEPPTPIGDYLFGSVNESMEIMVYHGSDWWIIGYGDQIDQTITFDYTDWNTGAPVYYHYIKVN